MKTENPDDALPNKKEGFQQVSNSVSYDQSNGRVEGFGGRALIERRAKIPRRTRNEKEESARLKRELGTPPKTGNEEGKEVEESHMEWEGKEEGGSEREGETEKDELTSSQAKRPPAFFPSSSLPLPSRCSASGEPVTGSGAASGLAGRRSGNEIRGSHSLLWSVRFLFSFILKHNTTSIPYHTYKPFILCEQSPASLLYGVHRTPTQ